MAFKRITPKMEKQMEYLLSKGCDEEYQYLDPDIAMLYSFLPGGGQFYTGEKKKGIFYIVSSPFFFPYITHMKEIYMYYDAFTHLRFFITFWNRSRPSTDKKTD